MSTPEETEVPAVKDAKQRPVPTAWRRTLQEVVRAFASGDYELTSGIASVEPVGAKLAGRMRGYVKQYPATLVDLPDETWKSSVSQWTGSQWEVFVDLWTAEAGRSDLVLSARVFEAGDGFRIRVDGLYVP
jgi:hypothetical protein